MESWCLLSPHRRSADSTRVVLIAGPRPDPSTDPGVVATTDDHVASAFDTAVTLPGSLNDRPSSSASRIRPELSRFEVVNVGPDDFVSTDKRTVRYPGAGPSRSSPTVSYVPPHGFVGTDAVNMLVIDDQLNRGVEELVVTVAPAPTAAPGAATSAR